MHSSIGAMFPREVPSEAATIGPAHAVTGRGRGRRGTAFSRDHVTGGPRRGSIATSTETVRRLLFARRLDSRELDPDRHRNELPALANPGAPRSAQTAHRR